MLSHCAACPEQFRYFWQGRVIPLHTKGHKHIPEFFWLCSNCCDHLDLKVDTEGHVQVYPKSSSKSSGPLPKAA